MSTEHEVGESVVVPGLKLTDHTFQVCCPQYIRQGRNIALADFSPITTCDVARLPGSSGSS